VSNAGRRFSWRFPAADMAHDLPRDPSGVEIMRVALMLAVFLALTTIHAGGGEQLKISVSPAHSFAPSNLKIRARVVPHDQNRALQIVAESADFYRSSQVPLDGERAPGMLLFEFRSLPGGDYRVYGLLTDSGGHQRAVAEQSVSVLSELGP
jgi:hypothetical protein